MKEQLAEVLDFAIVSMVNAENLDELMAYDSICQKIRSLLGDK